MSETSDRGAEFHAAQSASGRKANASGAATALGFGAILLWSTLATLTTLKGAAVPPFQTSAITFAIGGALLLAVAAARGRLERLRPSPAAFLLAVYGLFAYHALYFAALRLAPPAEAGLLSSLWALLTVLMSGLLPGHRLQGRHVAGALLGLGSAVLLVSGGGEDAGQAPSRFLGLALAGACAFVWASYSVLSRLVADTPSESLALPCFTTALLSLGCHALFETWTSPAGSTSWAALVLLGLGPVGGAFFLWDVGMKRGNIALLGVLAYASPVLSTGLLVMLGFAAPTWSLAIACGLMVAAAAVALA